MAERALVYLSYGRRREYALELTYAVASAVRFLRTEASNFEILLVTDAAGRRPDLPVRHVLFDDEMFARWTSNGSYTHAAKIHALMFVLEREGGSIALLDTDTFFTQHPDRLFDRIAPGRSVMHKAEHPIGEREDWQTLLDRAPPVVEGFPINGRSPMNNSGVIGLHHADRALLSRSLDLMTSLHRVSPVFNIEQLAVTLALGSMTTIATVPDVVRHYWGIERPFVHAAIYEALTSGMDAFDYLVAGFREFGVPPKRVPDQIRARFRGIVGGWSSGYRFAYLAYRCALSATTPAYRDAWALTAVNFLRTETVSRQRLKRDFGLLVDRQPDWMRPATKQAWIDIGLQGPG